MKLLTTMLLTITLAGCEQSDYSEAPDCTICVDGGAGTDAKVAGDAKPATDVVVRKLADAQDGYTDKGVYVNLGSNKCSYGSACVSQGGGWDPHTATCWGHDMAECNTTTSGVCGNYACGTYAPGTILVWDALNPRFRYWAGVEGGVVCLPNDVSYTIPCK